MLNHKLKTYEEFWPIYLKLHSKRGTQRLHVIGLLLGIAAFVIGLVLNRWALFILAPALGYGFAWYSHFFIEKNRPAAWTYPWWSLISDFRMAFLYLRGKI
jgi:hypothetical protein